VFTQNRYCAAPVQVCREHLKQVNAAQADTQIRALVINTGNANAGTGAKGLADARATTEALASLLKLQAQQIGQPFDPNYLTGYLQQQQLVNAGTGTGKTPSKYVQKNISNVTSIASTLDTIANDLLGRQLNEQEKAKYTAMLQNEQKKASSAVVTNTVPSGSTTASTTTGGLDAQQYLIQKIAGTDEAKANKVLTAYDTVTKMFGGLR
jgi:hypothetical protein